MSTKIKNNKNIIYITIPLLIIIAIITHKVLTQNELLIDKLAYNFLVVTLRTPWLTTIMKTVTRLSNTLFIIILAFVLSLLFYFKWHKKTIATLIPCNLITIALINQILKFIIQRERPTGYRLIEMTGYSFPSGHAMVSMAFYGLLIYIIYKLIKDKKIKNILIILNILIIILIGISRIYLGVHYLSDIIVGYSLSIIYLLILTKLLKKYKIFP